MQPDTGNSVLTFYKTGNSIKIEIETKIENKTETVYLNNLLAFCKKLRTKKYVKFT